MSTEESYERISYEKRQAFWNVIEGPYIVHAVLVFTVLSVLVPIFWMSLTSFKTPNGVFSPTYLPEEFTFQAYQLVVIREGYWRALLNSAIISTTTTAIVMVLSIPAGYAFSRFRFRFDNAIFIGVIFSRLFPPIGIIIPYFQGLSAFGLLNSRTGIILAQVYLWLPLMIYIMRNFFISIPKEIDESALVDGCTQLQAFRRVVVPLAMPGVAAVGILTFLYSWREFLFSFMISSTLASRPISVAVYDFVGEVNISWAQMGAAAVLAIIPTVLVVLFFQQYIVSGLTAGAMKGE
ncbi:carbohydrate ABC transporter permease [Halorarum halophilum]|uniref:Carbohydrate ABC transporter permease n=1 Tax=Halorarum halophilum TaxID=2743090 RepID=A0A7D5KF44_9EURY|nr:carbohydrate ABC transporter permease [Halobaculum halophilum]QLG27336.1 carbohydrate ABC transporter permease [Halobaculum halophilum]